MRIFAIFAAVFMLIGAPLAQAEAANVSKAEITRILSSQGYNVQDFGTNTVAVIVSDYKILVSIIGADGDVTYRVWPGLSGSEVSHKLLNKFNNDVKFGRVYIDRDGDVTIQMDRNSAGGVSAENIESDFDVFLTLIDKFLSDLESQAVA